MVAPTKSAFQLKQDAMKLAAAAKSNVNTAVENVVGAAKTMVSDMKGTTKRYFAKVPHSRFIMPDGTEITFPFGKIDIGPESHPTTWREYQKELDAIIGRNPTIYTQESIPTVQPLPPSVDPTANAKSEQEISVAEAALAGVNTKIQQQAGPIVASGPSNVNTSTVDSELMAAAFKTQGSGNPDEIIELDPKDIPNTGAQTSNS